MRYNIEDILAIEIKKEIADRYFGFRKLIEEDKKDVAEKIKQYSFILEKRISFDLIRIYLMLKDEELIQNFFHLTGLEEKLFYDPALNASSTIRDRVMEGVHLRGLTQSGRFKNFIFDCYDRLVSHVGQYREKFEELKEHEETINEEIKIFYQKNDLGSIIGFLRSLGDQTKNGDLEGGLEVGIATSLEKRLKIEPPLPIEYYLPIIPPLAPLQAIKKKLKKLVEQAFEKQSDEILVYFAPKYRRALR